VGSFKCQVQQRVEKLATTGEIQVGLIGLLSFDTRTQGVHGKILEVFGIVVFTRSEGIETSGQSINWRIKVPIIVIGENDVEVAIELRCSQFMKLPRHKCQANKVSLGALSR
jgi:hypothetical protein